MVETTGILSLLIYGNNIYASAYGCGLFVSTNNLPDISKT